jgi:hypothetical protein
MREFVDMHPEYGEDLVANFAHGLNLETHKHPFVVYERQVTFGNSMVRAMDGASLDKTQSNMITQHSFTAPIPKTEFGGILITFVSVKPDEVIASQPHPILSHGWWAHNHIADEMAIDPVPVLVRDLDSDCLQAQETNVVCYVGNNHMMKTYLNYGLNRQLDPTTVENKTAIWQLEVPMSVTPESVLYPENLGHYPFADQNAEVCTYVVNSLAVINTPIVFGPTPVENLAALDTKDVFEDQPVNPA